MDDKELYKNIFYNKYGYVDFINTINKYTGTKGYYENPCAEVMTSKEGLCRFVEDLEDEEKPKRRRNINLRRG